METRAPSVVAKTLPIFLLLPSGERAIGEPLDLANREETLQSGNYSW